MFVLGFHGCRLQFSAFHGQGGGCLLHLNIKHSHSKLHFYTQNERVYFESTLQTSEGNSSLFNQLLCSVFLQKNSPIDKAVYTRLHVVSCTGAVVCTCNPATLKYEFRNDMGSIPAGGNSLSIGGRIV